MMIALSVQKEYEVTLKCILNENSVIVISSKAL